MGNFTNRSQEEPITVLILSETTSTAYNLFSTLSSSSQDKNTSKSKSLHSAPTTTIYFPQTNCCMNPWKIPELDCNCRIRHEYSIVIVHIDGIDDNSINYCTKMIKSARKKPEVQVLVINTGESEDTAELCAQGGWFGLHLPKSLHSTETELILHAKMQEIADKLLLQRKML